MILARLRQTSFSLSKRAGLTEAVGSTQWRQERLLILCYHGVSIDDEHEWNPGLYISPATLARRLAILKKTGCTVLPLEDAVTRLYSGTLPPRTVVLTFDDGYEDFARKAHPLLRQYEYPATVYVPTQRVIENFPVAHLLLSYVLWRRRARPFDARGIAGLDGVYDLRDAAARADVLQRILQRFAQEGLGPARKDAIVRTAVARLDMDYQHLIDAGILRLMSPDRLRSLSGEGVSFELHTHTHKTPEDAEEFRRQVVRNRQALEAITGRAARHFCYPSGVYRPSYPAVLASEGVVSATTCDPDMASRESNALLLPRFVDTSLVGDVEFEAWVTGAACWLPRRTRVAHPQVA
jgi:peptidoglycan/xylan/chitin deacetylase (PgdA/CDA1 family)